MSNNFSPIEGEIWKRVENNTEKFVRILKVTGEKVFIESVDRNGYTNHKRFNCNLARFTGRRSRYSRVDIKEEYYD
jgi:hypothetical protein